jgi:hypothetical protein
VDDPSDLLSQKPDKKVWDYITEMRQSYAETKAFQIPKIEEEATTCDTNIFNSRKMDSQWLV